MIPKNSLRTESDASWCSATWRHTHHYSDWGTWVDHRHPECDYCGYIDTSRDLPPIKGHHVVQDQTDR
jgi:hypothetical protein